MRAKFVVELKFVWNDLWVGAYIDPAKRRLYIAPIPTIVLMIQLPGYVSPVLPEWQELQARNARLEALSALNDETITELRHWLWSEGADRRQASRWSKAWHMLARKYLLRYQDRTAALVKANACIDALRVQVGLLEDRQAYLLKFWRETTNRANAVPEVPHA